MDEKKKSKKMPAKKTSPASQKTSSAKKSVKGGTASAAVKAKKAAAPEKKQKVSASGGASASGSKKGKNAIRTASHDAATSQYFIDSMMKGWKSSKAPAVRKVPGYEQFAERRARLSKMFPGLTLIIPTGIPRVRSNDCDYPFRPGSSFFYLTGNKEPGCVLALVPKKKGKGHDSILFAEPAVDRSTPAFFLDRSRGALWVGAKLGLEGSLIRYGVTAARSIDEIGAFLKALNRSQTRLLRGFDPRCDGVLKQIPGDQELACALSEMRMIKDKTEIASMKKAIAATKIALEDSIIAMSSAHNEREIEAVFDCSARMQGNGVGFASITAAGSHACTLHWTQNDGEIKCGDLLLMDVGVEGNDLYSADISRTFPVDGRYSDAQRAIYDIVVRALEAAVRAAVPGAPFLAPHKAGTRVLTQGLIDLGIIKEPLESALTDEHQTYRRYTLHRISHLLGLDVHDSAAARPEVYSQGKLRPGMVLTVEPGLYFQPDDLTVPPAFRGIGIRVEDDVLITDKGHQVLSAAIPRKSADVEKWIAELWGDIDEEEE